MDGDQYRYLRVVVTAEYLHEKTEPLDIVSKMPSSYFYDEKTRLLYIHTSDGRPPTSHEIELFRRGNGIAMKGKHFITIVGFTLRHMGDAGINFFTGSSDCAALHNTAYGSRQGIRVYGATNILVYGNTLFRNENSGVYFAAGSTNGTAARNMCFEDVKGIRWSSKSDNGIATDNVLFDNSLAGVSIEDSDHIMVAGNILANNAQAQLFTIQGRFLSDDNCFTTSSAQQLVADYHTGDRYSSLADYQRAQHQDLASRSGTCGVLPQKVDVRKLYAEAMTYTPRAREQLRSKDAAATQPAAGSGTTPNLPR
jgi:parallel beta-helix repeat protein